MGCNRSGVLAPSAAFWGLSQCQDLIPDGDGVGTCQTHALVSNLPLAAGMEWLQGPRGELSCASHGCFARSAAGHLDGDAGEGRGAAGSGAVPECRPVSRRRSDTSRSSRRR